MNSELKNRILANRFVVDLRVEGIINYDEYHALCEALEELGNEWRNETSIDKELVEDIFTSFVTISGELWALEKTPIAEEARKIVLNLHRLIILCFSPHQTPEEALESYNERLKLWGKEDSQERD